MMGYEANKPAFAGSSQSAQADLVSPIAHDFNRGTGVWIRYPCGVACGAGDLVEQQKPLDGGSWTTSALYLQGISLVRRNSEWHHFDPLGTAGVSGFNKAPAGCISARQEPRPPQGSIASTGWLCLKGCGFSRRPPFRERRYETPLSLQERGRGRGYRNA